MTYFAYGSNMLARRLTDRSRAPSAVACGVARAPGFVVRYHKVGADGSGKCTLIATIDNAAAAFGVVYEMTNADAVRLDRVEGVHTGGYIRRSIQLRLRDDRRAEAMTYVAGEPACRRDAAYRSTGTAISSLRGRSSMGCRRNMSRSWRECR